MPRQCQCCNNNVPRRVRTPEVPPSQWGYRFDNRCPVIRKSSTRVCNYSSGVGGNGGYSSSSNRKKFKYYDGHGVGGTFLNCEEDYSNNTNSSKPKDDGTPNRKPIGDEEEGEGDDEEEEGDEKSPIVPSYKPFMPSKFYRIPSFVIQKQEKNRRLARLKHSRSPKTNPRLPPQEERSYYELVPYMRANFEDPEVVREREERRRLREEKKTNKQNAIAPSTSDENIDGGRGRPTGTSKLVVGSMEGGPGKDWSKTGAPSGQPSFIEQGGSNKPLNSGTEQPGQSKSISGKTPPPPAKSTHSSPKPHQKHNTRLKSTSPKPISQYKPQTVPSKPYKLFKNPSSEQHPWIGSDPDPPKTLTGVTIKRKPKSSSPPKKPKQEPQNSSGGGGPSKPNQADKPDKPPSSSNNKKKDGDEEEENGDKLVKNTKTIPPPTKSKPAPAPAPKKDTEKKPSQEKKAPPKKSVKVIPNPTKKEKKGVGKSNENQPAKVTKKPSKKKSEKKEGEDGSSDSSENPIVKVVQKRTSVPKVEPEKDTDDEDDIDDEDDRTNDSEEFVKITRKRTIVTTRKNMDNAPEPKAFWKEPEPDSEDD